MIRTFTLLVFISLVFAPFLNVKASDLPGKSPKDLVFIPNLGQWEGPFLYRVDLHGGQLFLEDKAFTYLFFPKDLYHGHDHGDNKRFIEINGEKVENPDFHDHPQPETEPAHAYKVHFLGANKVTTQPAGRLAEYHNYFYGNDESRWRTNVPLYEGVRYPSLYKGIDLLVYSEYASVKYDFIVSRGANPADIVLEYEGVNGLRITEDGHLEITTSVNTIHELKPYAYQMVDGMEKEVPCHYAIKGNKVHYIFPEGFDPNNELIIDPALIFSTYMGSTADNWGFTSTYDKEGNMYVGGIAIGSGYPTTSGAFQTAYRGADCDVAITKLNNNGSQRLFSTYLGGGRTEYPMSLIVDEQNNLVVFGVTGSNNFPLTPGAFQTIYQGGGNFTPIGGLSFTSGVDIFLTKFNATGTALIGSTYYGGSGIDGVNSNNGSSNFPTLFNYGDNGRGEVNLTPDGRILIGTSTYSTNIPITPGAAQPTKSTNQDGLIACFSPDLTQLIFSTYVGGGGEDAIFGIQQDGAGNIFVCGGTSSNNLPAMAGGVNATYRGGRADGFIIKLNSNATAFLAGTYLGTGTYDQAYLLDLDRNGNVYVVGQTLGSYPVTPGVYSNANAKQFIHKVNNNLNATIFSTTFGRANYQYVNIAPTALLVDDCENIHVVGWGGGNNWDFQLNGGYTDNMPVTSDGYKRTTDGSDFYLITLKTDAASLLYGSFFGENGGNGDHVDGGTSRFDKAGIVYQGVCASCGGTNGFPTTAGVISRNNRSSNCNMAGFKFQFDLDALQVLSLGVSSDSGCAPLTVSFNYTSSRPGTSFFWDFGDGGSSTAEFPTHTFNTPGTYRVKFVIRNPSSCNPVDSAFTTIKVVPRSGPKAIFDLDSSQKCVDGSILLINNSTDATRYFWDFGDGTTSTSASSPITKVYTSPGTYTITLRAFNSTLCDTVNVAAKTVTIPPIVTAEFAFSGTPCVGQSISFTNQSINGVSYSWTFPGGATSTQTNPTFTFNTAGTFDITLVATNNQTCNRTDDVVKSITIDEAVVTINPPGPLDICTGQSTVLTATPGFSPYTWTRNGQVINGANASTLTVDQNGNYQVSVTNANGCQGQSNTVSVTVADVLSIDLIPANAVICEGQQVTLSITTPSLVNIVWFRNGQQVASGQNTLAVSTPGNYNVTAESTGGCQCTSNTVAVTQSNTPTVTIIPAGPTTICQGSSTTLTLATPNLQNVQWRRDGVAISGQTGNTLSVNQSGIYSVTAENQDGCPGVSNNSEVVVAPLPVLQISPAGPIAICSGDNAVLSLSPSGLQNIIWTRDGSNINGATAQTLTVTQAGSYSATAQSAEGCPGSANTVLVNVQAQFAIDISANAGGFCPGGNVVLTINTPGVQGIQWLLNGNAISGATGNTYTATVAGNYSVAGQSPSGCPGASNVVNITESPIVSITITPAGPSTICQGSSITLTLQTPNLQNVQWRRDGTVIPNQTGSTLTVNQAGIYSVTAVSPEGCPATSNNSEVVVAPLPNLQITPAGPVSICTGTSTVLTLNPPGLQNIIWTRDGSNINGATAQTLTVTQAGNYSAGAQSTSGCPGTANVVSVVVNDSFTIAVSPAGPVDICEGQTTTLTIQNTGLTNIQWFRNGTLVNGQSGVSLTVDVAGSYTVRALGPTSCPGNSIPVVVNVVSPPRYSFPENPSICEGEDVVLDAGPSGATTYLWSTGATTAQITASNAGTYTVELSNGKCSSTSSVTVSLLADPPTVSLGNDTTICSDAGFVLLPKGTNILSYRWSDGSTGNSFAVKEAGQISVVVEGACGTAEASINVAFKECGCKVFVPNAFTPNKDGNNDVLKPLYKCPVEDIWFMVFNRWGEKVFETRELGKGWDGIYKNQLQPNDAYLYYVRYFDPSISQSFEEKGTALLLK